jgi:septum formation protein
MSRQLPKDELLLASRSPRRRRLLIEGGLDPIVAPVVIEEARRADEDPLAFVTRLAEQKAAAAVNAYEERGLVILAADTIVVHQGAILGKPRGAAEARAMLEKLAGERHEVMTSISLIDRASHAQVTRVGRTALRLRQFGPGEIEAYIDDGSPLDKAGAYGIQDGDFQPVDLGGFEGCFTNVMGLPLCLLEPSLSDLGWSVEADLTAACFSYVPHDLAEVYVGA